MARNVRNASSTSTGAAVFSGAHDFLVREYDSANSINNMVGESDSIAEFMCEVGSTVDRYYYFYPAYSHAGNSSGTHAVTGAWTTTPTISGLSFSAASTYMRLNGTVGSTSGPFTAKFELTNIDPAMKFPNGSLRKRTVTVPVRVVPAGTLPVWSDASSITEIVPQGQSNVTLISAPTGGYSGKTFSLAGTYPSWISIDSKTGRVYATSVPTLNETAYTTYNINVVATVSADGLTFTKSFSRTWKVNNPYGAVYWGPGALMSANYSSWGDQRSSSNAGLKYGTAIFNQNITSGAIKNTNRSYDTSPYAANSGYGLEWTFDINWSSGSTGYLWSRDSSQYTAPTTQISIGYCYRFLWKVPAGVTKICIVAVGGGCGGSYSWSSNGGGGGGMGWVNDVTVTPGEELEICVGLAGAPYSSDSSYWGGVSYVRRTSIAEYLAIGYGGGYQTGHSIDTVTGTFPATTYSGSSNGRNNPQSGPGGLYFVELYNQNNSRDAGSAAASTRYGTYGANYGGYASSRPGGGAAGWTGRGGNNDERGYGGGGGSGYYYSSTYGTSAGGGVGLDGQGSSGPYGDGSGLNGSSSGNTEYGYGQYGYRYCGGGGSGGARGSYGENAWTTSGISNQHIDGGCHGGGGGGSGTSWGGGSGGMGGVRIIWGPGRAFPNTLCSEDPAYPNLATTKP